MLFQHFPATLWFTSGLVGLVMGSFLNVVIYRLPIMIEANWNRDYDVTVNEGEITAGTEKPFNLAVPKSACPNCKYELSSLDNIPVISWLVLGGQCRKCKADISIRYPTVELLTAVLSVIVAMTVPSSINLIFSLILTWCLIALTAIDFDKMLLPDRITLPLIWCGLFLNMNSLWVSPADAIAGAIAGYLVLLFAIWVFEKIFKKDGLGYGDAKLFAALGAWFGWQSLLVIISLSIAFGFTFILLAVYSNKVKLKDKQYPFGPFLAASGWLYMILGSPLTQMMFGVEF
ncbi:type 4 prepilin-like proteins leader peptide-processing enzyme [Moritella sp. F3]|nr:type 4 prepilin-like proteins leader peptide-processing enzyme [Moritella sp. F1]GIC82070.1 type 4 prepilin-like proteins leader peptide-processing enzyme [Moritella sp. F3]